MRRARTGIVALSLIALMAIGSIVMWLVVPFAWIYGVSQHTKSSQPSMGSYVLLLVAIPATMVVVGKLLGRLNRFYGTITGTAPTMRVQVPWHKSMRGDRGSGHPRTILDVVMVFSVSIALLCFAVWFFAFAGSSLPS